MKKLLLILLLIPAFGFSQNQFSFGFSGTTAAMVSAGWQQVNLSNPAGPSLWSIPATAPTATFVGGGQAGGATSFALINFTSVAAASAGTISNWLITPVINVQNGDVVTFYTRYGGTAAQEMYADNMQFLMSTNGGATVIPSVDENDLGDFTNNLVEINATLAPTGYPATWTQYSHTITGLSAATDVMFAFRYYVTDGGPNGTNSDIIGIDTFSVDRPLSTNDFFKNNLSVSPNPTKDLINISNRNNVLLNSAVITDVNGRVVIDVNLKSATNTQINVSELTTGVYFLKIITDQGVGTTKIIKN